MAVLVTLFLGLFFLVGMLVIKYASDHEWIEHISYAIAFGAMVGIVVLDLIPEILEVYEPSRLWQAVLLVAAGIGLLKLLDRFIPEHEEADEENPAHIGIMATIAIVIHNIIEGMTVCSVCLNDMSSGLVLALGVGLHNIPMGMLIYSSLHQEKKGKRYTLMFLAAISAFVGGCLMLGISAIAQGWLSGVLMCLALGMILFIAAFELLPLLLHEKNRRWNIIGVLIGLAIVGVSIFLE